MIKYFFLVIIQLPFFLACSPNNSKRTEISLNGPWQIAKTDHLAEAPPDFQAKVPVPGLVDLAQPSMDDQDTSYDNSLYWYKTTFSVEQAPVVQLKVNKAKYHTTVYVNGQFAGENLYNFTPGYFNIRPLLRDQENELMISVGCLNNLPDTILDGQDFEKMKYIPGIYDEVKIIATGYPLIKNTQVVPDPTNESVKMVVELEQSEPNQTSKIEYIIRELASRKIVAQGLLKSKISSNSKSGKMEIKASIPGARLWSPESPFLYELELKTDGDQTFTRFGMRSFDPDPDGGPFLLNGDPYYLRGTNVCILRFFEDPNRQELPWNDHWVTDLHRKFKDMNWNSIRYCIGFPPERWYEIADSLGILIQDEYPIWTLNSYDELYPKIKARHIAAEYKTWLPERWNHPCVVIWDAQNESKTTETGEAIKMVRDLDLSGRPWDNGWAAPVNKTDPVESHPYLFSRYRNSGEPSEQGALSDLLNEVHMPFNGPNDHSPSVDGSRYSNPIIINEYGWLWLNRNGTTTTLTDRVYEVAFDNIAGPEQRLKIYAHHLGMLTEYWRVHRKAVGVMHFCGLGYSRPEEPRGQTSDHFIDLENLVLEPNFVEYVKPAFSPVGVMLNFWENSLPAGERQRFEIIITNDLGFTWNGPLKLSWVGGSGISEVRQKEMKVTAYQSRNIFLEMPIPSNTGSYQLIAEIEVEGEPIKSIRNVKIK